MNTKKETPNSKLQKSSVIFMQLGLILALLAVYVTLEHKSLVFAKIYEEPFDPTEEKTRAIGEIKIEKKIVYVKPKTVIKKPVVVIVPKPIIDITKIKFSENDSKIIETKLTASKIDEPVKLTPKPVVVKVVKPIKIKITSAKFVQKAPTFPGCNSNDEIKKRACFNKKMSKHINRYFNVHLAQDLGLSAGKKRISVQFIIDEYGNIIDVIARAPHKRLEKEAKRLINKLPKMIPGQQNSSKVRVRYNLPINFNVED